jgi:DNA-binding PadR family transcriptional regulator
MSRVRREGPEPDDFLPLPRDTFDVLVSLADRDRHGYAILQDIAERTDGRIRLSPSTLYAVIKRLLESELIEELSERPDPAHDDERRRYYRLTPLGRRVAESEAARLTRLLADARASGLVPRRRCRSHVLKAGRVRCSKSCCICTQRRTVTSTGGR